MEENISRLQELNKLVAEARKRVECLKKKRTALYLREQRVDVQTWMLNNLVDDACRDLEEIRRLRNNQGTLCQGLLCRKLALFIARDICQKVCEKELIIQTFWHF